MESAGKLLLFAPISCYGENAEHCVRESGKVVVLMLAKGILSIFTKVAIPISCYKLFLLLVIQVNFRHILLNEDVFLFHYDEIIKQ